MSFKRSSRGFTLIELLVVISIIGLLSSFLLASLSQARGKARDAKRKSELKQLQTALELYYSDNSGYPVDCWNTSPTNYIPGLAGTYITVLPRDPSYGQFCDAIGGNDGIWNYHYCSNLTVTSYKINTCSDSIPAANDPFYDPVRGGNKFQVCTGQACTGA